LLSNAFNITGWKLGSKLELLNREDLNKKALQEVDELKRRGWDL